MVAGAPDPTVTIGTVDPGVLPAAVDAPRPRSDLVLGPLALTITAEEAVAAYRRLAAANPADYEAALASSLKNLSGSLADAGRHDEALAAAEEAVSVYYRLASADPAAYEPDLATSLNNLSAILADAGRHDEALAAAEEAVSACRRLAAADPAAYEADLATSLNNLSAEVIRRQETLLASLDSLWDVLALAAQHKEALEPIEEAVAIYRRLAAANPAVYELGLAASLNNLSDIFAWVGRRDEALAAVEEAVAVYRRLAAANPAAYEPDLTASLNHLSLLEQPAKPLFPTSSLIVFILLEITKGCLGIAILAVQVFTSWQELKGQPLR
jgi:tetratricopeptide (TPR) repeat protein